MSNGTAPAAGTKSTPLGKKIWACAITFGLIGQIAWVVENMFFAKFGQDLFDTRGDLYFTVTTLMVILSAVTATVTTIFAGGLIDKTVTIMLFAAIPIDFSNSSNWGIIAALVILDCVMTFFGSTANDAAFNTWVADVTDVTNRGKVNTILSVMPVIATVLVFGIGMLTYDNGATVTNDAGEVIKVAIADRDGLLIKLFFIIMGIFPMVGGVLSAFMMKDSPNIVKNSNPDYFKETFYGFRPSVVKENKMMYVTLGTVCLLGIAQQIFMSYLINFIEKTLGITNYILPLAVIIVVGAVITGVLGVFFELLLPPARHPHRGRGGGLLHEVHGQRGISSHPHRGRLRPPRRHTLNLGRPHRLLPGLYPEGRGGQIPRRQDVLHRAHPHGAGHRHRTGGGRQLSRRAQRRTDETALRALPCSRHRGRNRSHPAHLGGERLRQAARRTDAQKRRGDHRGGRRRSRPAGANGGYGGAMSAAQRPRPCGRQKKTSP